MCTSLNLSLPSLEENVVLQHKITLKNFFFKLGLVTLW